MDPRAVIILIPFLRRLPLITGAEIKEAQKLHLNSRYHLYLRSLAIGGERLSHWEHRRRVEPRGTN